MSISKLIISVLVVLLGLALIPFATVQAHDGAPETSTSEPTITPAATETPTATPTFTPTSTPFLPQQTYILPPTPTLTPRAPTETATATLIPTPEPVRLVQMQAGDTIGIRCGNGDGIVMLLLLGPDTFGVGCLQKQGSVKPNFIN